MDVDETATYAEVLAGILFLIFILIFHGTSLRAINRRFSDAWVRVNALTPRWKINFLLALVIGSLTAVHLVEPLLWTLPILWLGMLPSLRDSYFFVLETYTTLGGGSVELPDHWRLLGPMIGMSGMFTFSWTVSVLVTVMNEFGKLDRTRATKDQRETERRPDGGGA